MILPIYIYGQPVLREEAQDITAEYPRLKETIQDMFDTLDNSGGIGLAAPQVGLPIRLVVIDLDVMSDEKPEYKGYRTVFINADIEEYGSEEDVSDEGCLSIPGIYEKVRRPTSIKVRYLDEKMEEHCEWISGYLARVLQHEIDHLNGELFIDHISALRKQMIKSKLANLQKGKVSASYKVKVANRKA